MQEYTFYNYMIEVQGAKPWADELTWLEVMKDCYWDDFKLHCKKYGYTAIF